MFEKKFGLRVKHFIRKSYCIEYTYYRFIPSWNTLNKWFYLESTPGYERQDWDPILLPYSEAIEFAKHFKTINDIEEHYKKQEIIRAKQLKIYEDWCAKNQPKDIVNII